jgi:murein DD-endopeptidase MepM/ murein hydrolase activator NlpD
MPPVSEQAEGAGPRTASTRGRWLFAITVFVAGIAPLCQIAQAVDPAKPACPGATYSVVSGDSWYRIATNLKISMTSLINANGATTATVIHPGQTLCLPADVAAPAPTTTTPTTAAPTPNATPTATPTAVYPISAFPAQGPCSFTDTYGASRSGGRSHEGVDIIAKAGQWVYAVKDGTLTRQYFNTTGSLSGNGWRLTTSDGTYFFYAHLSAFASGLAVGSAVKAGQIIGQVGMTGNASIAHLHFEVHPSGGAPINPTSTVKAVDGCKTSAVPPQPNGNVPATTVPATTVPAPTGPAPTLPPVTEPAPTTTTVYVPVAHRRDATYLDGTARPRR